MTNSTKTLDIFRVRPFSDSATSVSESSLHLTYFDMMGIRIMPTEHVYFYQLPEYESTHTFFHSVVIPKFKHSLSLVLTHFLPTAGNIVWPIDAPKPFILYTPGDGISFVVAESNLDFNCFTHGIMCEAANLHAYVPGLLISDTKASIISFQVTLFPNQGFSLGISMHHTLFDGKSATMFMKSWAHVCKENWKQPTSLPLELTPVFDRTLVHDPHGLDMLKLNGWTSISDPNLKSLKVPRVVIDMDNLARADFNVSQEDVSKLRKNVVSHLSEDDSKNIHFSTFVLVYAYIIVTMVKAKKLEKGGKISFRFAADCRSRLNPKLPENYFGNCTRISYSLIDTETVLAKHGIASIANELSKMVKLLETRVTNLSTEQEKEDILQYENIKRIADMMIGVTASPRFGFYAPDFGWGKPTKSHFVSIDKINVLISMVESRDGNGGIEIGVVLKKHEMEMFNSLFADGLNDM